MKDYFNYSNAVAILAATVNINKVKLFCLHTVITPFLLLFDHCQYQLMHTDTHTYTPTIMLHWAYI